MPAYNFQPQFVPLILDGTKHHTIRRRRKRPTKPGDVLKLYTGQRTKDCRLVLETICTSVVPVQILPFMSFVMLEGKVLSAEDTMRFAMRDGFQSVRRGKPEVKDIEIVCIPDPAPVPRAPLEFGKPVPPVHKTQLDKLVHAMKEAGDIILEANGDRYKKMYLKYAGIRLDLFINIPPSEWGVQMVIRTGPKEFDHWCVTSRKHGGALPEGYFVKHQVVWLEGLIDKRDIPDDPNKAVQLLTPENHLSMPEEIDFLAFLGLGWIEPKDRVAKWKK